MTRERWRHESEWDGDDDDFDSYDSEDGDSDLYGDDSEPTIACPHCRREVHEDAQRCPYCGNYLSNEDSTPPRRKPWWIVIGALLVMYIVFRWSFG